GRAGQARRDLRAQGSRGQDGPGARQARCRRCAAGRGEEVMGLWASAGVPPVLALAPSRTDCRLDRSESSAPSGAGFPTAFEMTGAAFEMTGPTFEMTEKAHR